MRSSLTLGLFVATACSVSAQLQNGGFEDLNTADMPAYWTTGTENIVIGDSVVVDSAKYLLNSTDVHSGQYAAELRNAYDYTLDQGSPGEWIASPFEEGYGGFPSADVPVIERPSSLHFWAKYSPVSGDSGYVEVKVIGAQGEVIGAGTLQIVGLVDAYTAFDVPIDYSSTDSAAYINIRFSTMVPGGDPHLGTRMLIDDVSVEYAATGIASVDAPTLRLSPNPASNEVLMTGLPLGSSATATLTDALGRTVLVQPLLNGRLALNGQVPGAYVLRVEQGGVMRQGRLVIAR